MTITATVDVAGARMVSARYGAELYGYLSRSERKDISIIGSQRRVDPAWLIRREIASAARSRRIALNNVSFVAPGERWTLLRNALHFLTDGEASHIDPSLRGTIVREATVCAGRQGGPMCSWCHPQLWPTASRESSLRRAARSKSAPTPYLQTPPRLCTRYGHPLPSAIRPVQADGQAACRTAESSRRA